MALYSRGQTLVLYAGVLVVLLGAIGLCTDAGVFYVHWQLLQRAADSAALAGASYLPSDTSTAQSGAVSMAEKNGILSTEITSTPVSANDLSITVNLTRTVPYYFARALGMTTGLVSVSATAGVQPNPADTRGLIPVGLSCPNGATTGNCNGDYTVGATYSMKQDQSQTSLSGNWGALALGGNGASVYQQNLEFGYNGNIGIGTNVATESGNIVGPTGQAVADRVAAGVLADPTIAAGAAPPPSNVPTYDPRLIAVPMVDFSASGKGGKTSVPVVLFAQMWLLGVSGNNNTIQAVFLGTLPNPPTGSTVNNFGLLTPVLQS
jgi:Flp pilus assembly protein TadG